MANWTQDPPSEAGNYLWRKAEGGEAFASRVWAVDLEGLYITIGCTNYHVSEVGGEWLKLPSPDELEAMYSSIAASESLDRLYEVEKAYLAELGATEFANEEAIRKERKAAARSALKKIREGKP